MGTPARQWLAAFLTLAAAAGPSRAQFYLPPPLSTLLNTSIRSAAMGYAGSAVTWGEPDVWANPATLAGVNGLGWVAGHTKVAPELSQDLVFTSQRLLVGGGGVGFSFMGEPITGLGKSRYQFPAIALPLGGSGDTPYDQTQGWGVGVSPLRLIETVRKLGKLPPRSLTRYGDVQVGYQAKFSTAHFDSDTEFEEASTYDWGVGGRLALARWWGGVDVPYRLDLSGAYSQVNVLQSQSKDSGASTEQLDRFGVALRLAAAPPSERSASPPSMPWWRPGDVPQLAMGLAYDHDRRHVLPYGTSVSSIDHYGFEATLYRLLSLRVGYLSDSASEIEGMTYGGGLTLPIGPWASVGYQLASVPMPADLDRQFRQGWSVWLDPARVWSDTH